MQVVTRLVADAKQKVSHLVLLDMLQLLKM